MRFVRSMAATGRCSTSWCGCFAFAVSGDIADDYSVQLVDDISLTDAALILSSMLLLGLVIGLLGAG